MANDFNLFPQAGESPEQHEHRVREAVLDQDWQLRFQADGAELRALGRVRAEETDPLKKIALTEQRGASSVRCLGSGALSLWKDGVLAERQQFEADFGQPSQES